MRSHPRQFSMPVVSEVPITRQGCRRSYAVLGHSANHGDLVKYDVIAVRSSGKRFKLASYNEHTRYSDFALKVSEWSNKFPRMVIEARTSTSLLMRRRGG